MAIDSGDSGSTTMASTPTATVDVLDCDDPLLDLASFFERASHFDALEHLGTFLKMSIQKMFPRAPNYDDNVVADLPTFLKMATYEDPIDDLAVFLERASRWACSTRLVGPEGTFYLFAELPCEIRLMIWGQCIPNQVHLVSEPVYGGSIVVPGAGDPHVAHVAHSYDYHSRHCISAYPMPPRPKTPVIANVNREARAVSLARKSKRYTLVFECRDMDGSRDQIREAPVWLDEERDTVVVNTQHMITTRYPDEAVHLTEDGNLDYKADRLFGMVTRNKIQVAILAALFLDMDYESRHLYQALPNFDRVEVVVGVFRFEGMSNSEAAVTELFGLFGEESMALVPVNNCRSLRKLFMAHAAFRPDCVAEFFLMGDAKFIDEGYIPAQSKNWARCRRPSDFDKYCEEMRGLASAIMTACEEVFREGGFVGKYSEEASLQWEMKVDATFKDKCEPVFLVHRCRNPVLIDSIGRHGLGWGY